MSLVKNEMREDEVEEDCKPVMAKLSSCPKLFYLDQSLYSPFHDVTIIAGFRDHQLNDIAGDGAPPPARQLRTHVALLGATCAVLKDALLSARLSEEQEVVILAPDYTFRDIQTFGRVLGLSLIHI